MVVEPKYFLHSPYTLNWPKLLNLEWASSILGGISAADPQQPDQKEISPDTLAYHFRKWCRDGSLKPVWQTSIAAVGELLDIAELHLDGSHTIAKKGGETVA